MPSKAPMSSCGKAAAEQSTVACSAVKQLTEEKLGG